MAVLKASIIRLNIRSCMWQFVPAMYYSWEVRRIIHCDIGVQGRKHLRSSCPTVVGPDDAF